jgi:helicase MOV-10
MPTEPSKHSNQLTNQFFFLIANASFSATLLGEGRRISNSRPRTIVVIFHPSYEGRYEDTLELFFNDKRRRQRFAITRRIRAVVGCNDDHEQLKPTKPYGKRKWTPLKLDGPVIPSLRPPTWTATKWRVRLPDFKIPAALIKDAFVRDGRRTVKQRHMPAAFEPSTYGKHFQTMLFIEEEQRRSILV